MLRALGSTSYDIIYETGTTICDGLWALCLVRDRGHDLLRALGSTSYDIIYETGTTICDGLWALHLLISLTSQGVRFAPGIGFCVL